MKTLLLLLVSLSMSIASELPIKSIVKIFSTKSTPNYLYPWQTDTIGIYTGSGAIIKGNKILTAAHVVSRAKRLEVKKENDPKKYLATIKYISHQADLAILEVFDKDFFSNTEQLNLSTDVKVRDEVTVIGYPIGGQNVSSTTGVISRIEQQYYAYSAEQLLTIQVDAAINSGNSGGAVINNKNQLIGIAMMKNTKAENIAYIVPTAIIETFLEDTKDNIVNGFSKEETYIEPIENATLKEYYGLKNGNGVLVSTVDKYNTQLKVNDIILSIDGQEIANNGTISTKYGRISFTHIYNTKQIGDSVKLNILRDKKLITIIHKIKKTHSLIEYEFAKSPRYIIYGGLVFSPITENYLATISKQESNYINKKLYSKKKSDDYHEAITMLPTVFPNEVNKGYSNWASVLESINGIKIKSFNHLVNVLDNIQDNYTKFEFSDQSTIILNTKKAKDSFLDLKEIYKLNSNRNTI